MTQHTKSAALALAAAFSLSAPAVFGALRVVESVPGADFDVDQTGTVVNVEFTAAGPIGGVGFEGLWTAVVTAGAEAPWSVDLGATITPPGAAPTEWDKLGGEISIADYPLHDATALTAPGGPGVYEWDFSSVSGPAVAGLRGVTFHALETVPDVVEVINDTTAGGPMWDRPFSIVGVSGLGPVAYNALEFTVSESGLYVLESVLDTGSDHWASLYEGEFDPEQPLMNQLDYGLGNGFDDNDTPRGTARISALLLEGRTYTLVNSQWASFRSKDPYTLTITGPAAIVEAGACPADLDGDGVVGSGDLGQLLAAWGGTGPADLDGDGAVGSGDLGELLAAWGPCD